MPPSLSPSSAGSAVLADSVELVARWLQANGASAERAAPVAAAVVKYGHERELDLLLVVGIIGVENPLLDARARSHDGATGVMQVRPAWKRDIRGCGDDLRDVDINICFGTRILRMAIDGSKTLAGALRRYNGCTGGKRCNRYIDAVFRRTGRAVLLGR